MSVPEPKPLPRPPRSADPMALLSVLGDPERAKEAKEYLAELNTVLAENVKVRDEALAAIAEANDRLEAAKVAEDNARATLNELVKWVGEQGLGNE